MHTKLVNDKPKTAYIVGYACGTSKGQDDETRQYVRLLVSQTREPASFSRFSVFESDELLEKCKLEKANLTFPELGKREIRTAFANEEACPELGQRILWSVKHCPCTLPGSKSILDYVMGVSKPAEAEQDAATALRNRYLKAESIYPCPEILAEHKEFILSESTTLDEIYAALHDNKSWIDELKALL